MYKLGLFVAALLVFAGVADAQSLSVSYHQNLITVRCNNVALVEVFEEIGSATGLVLFLEDPVKGKRLTADIEAQPLHRAVERLLAGVGVNYAMMFDQADWQRVAKIFIGEGGGAVASSQSSPEVGSRRAPVRGAAPAVDEAYQEEPYDEAYPAEPEEEFETAEEEIDPDETGEVDESIEAEQPEGQDYLPPPPSFPRSSFTPGLESSPFGTATTEQPSTGTPSRPGRATRPPAYYPFTDQFGRPIPVPGNPNQPPEQDPQEQQEEEQPQQ